jgi:CHAT domain-containing protein/tetratricopeptide (TPR) repeat protein
VNGDDHLIDRLTRLGQADREAMLRLEPRCCARDFIARLIGRLDDESGLFPLACEVLTFATKQDASLVGGLAQVALQWADRLRAAGHADEALEVLERLEQSTLLCNAKLATVYARAGRLRMLIDQPDVPLLLSVADGLLAALEAVEASTLPPTHRTAIAFVLDQVATRAYYEARNFSAAARIAERASRLADNPTPLLIAGIAYLASGKRELARETYRKLAPHFPDSAMVQFNLGGCELVLGNVEAGLQALRRACDLSPNEGTYQLNTAIVLSDHGRIEEAMAMLAVAEPLCERIARDEPERTILMSSGDRLSFKDAVAWARFKIGRTAIDSGHSDSARQLLDVLANGDSGDRWAGAVLRSEIASRAGTAKEEKICLDEAVAAAPAARESRLRRADFHIGRREYDEAIEDLAYLVRNTNELEDVVKRLDGIRQQAPDHPAAMKWLGCAITYPWLERMEEGISLLDRVIQADPGDAYALLRRGLARITLRLDDHAESTSLAEVTAALTDLGLAAEPSKGEPEAMRAYQWVIDRVSVNPMVFAWIVGMRSEPGGIASVLPGALPAMQDEHRGQALGVQRAHREAVALLRDAQARLLSAGLPAYSRRVDLAIADNLLRLGDVQGARDLVDGFESAYFDIVMRPLTPSLDKGFAEIAARNATAVRRAVGFELEFMHIQSMAASSVMPIRDTLLLQIHEMIGNRKAALAVAADLEKSILTAAKPDSQQISIAAGIIPLLREAGELGRARALLEHIRPHADDEGAAKLDFIHGTLLLREGKRKEAIEVYRTLRSAKNALAPGDMSRVQMNLAALLADDSPAEALVLLSPYLQDSSLSLRDSISIRGIAARAAIGTRDAEAATHHAEAGLQSIALLRATLTRAADRVGLLGVYQPFIEEAISILVECGASEAVFSAIEGMRARTLVEWMDLRAPAETAEPDPIRTEIKRLERVAAELGRLTRGVALFGPQYVDAEAVRFLQATDSSLDILKTAGDRIELSAENLNHCMGAAKTRLEEARTRLERQWASRLAEGGEEGRGNSAALCEALSGAVEADRRSVFVSIVPTADDIALVFTSSHKAGAWVRKTTMRSADLRQLGAMSTLPREMERAEVQSKLGAVLAPIVEETRPGDHVVLGVTGLLSRIPFHAVTVEGAPWCARNTVCYAPSGAVLRRCLKQDPPTEGVAMVVGDPLGDLPKARDEARAVARHLGVEGLLGGEATTHVVLKTLVGWQIRHAHFSCHGHVDASDGMRSALLLAPVDGIDDGHLTAEALLDANLAGARVVMSACETGIGEEKTEVESFGLPRAALAAGARSVVASLWAMDDTASYLLMRELYRRLSSESAGQALRGAQLWLRTLSAGDMVDLSETALAGEQTPEVRARFLIDRAGAELHAGDFGAARRTYQRMVEMPPVDAAVPELTRAQHALRLLAQRGDLPDHPDYHRKPFAPIYYWAPLVLMGDWR